MYMSCGLPRGNQSRRIGKIHGYERIIVGTPTAAPNHHLRMSERYSFSVACASLSISGSVASAARVALYGPALSTALASKLKSPITGEYSTLTSFVAAFIVAPSTPGVALSAFSILTTHSAQYRPLTFRRM